MRALRWPPLALRWPPVAGQKRLAAGRRAGSTVAGQKRALRQLQQLVRDGQARRVPAADVGVCAEAWELVEGLAARRQLGPHHCTVVLGAAVSPGEVGRIARLADDAGLEGDEPTVRTLFKAWCRCEHYAYAVAVLRDAVDRGVVERDQARVMATKPLVAAAGRREGQQARSSAWTLFDLLQEEGLADKIHANIMLPLCSAPSAADADESSRARAPTVAELMEQLGGGGGTDTFNTRLREAAREPGREGETSCAAAAAALVAEMRQAGVPPDAATYSLLHTCYLEAGSAAAAADVLAEARAVVPREWTAAEVSKTATMALRKLRTGDEPDFAWEYGLLLQKNGGNHSFCGRALGLWRRFSDSWRQDGESSEKNGEKIVQNGRETAV